MTIKLWKNFSKRKNSTKQPSAASATDVTAVLKDNCSIEAPRFIITGVDFDWNYAQAFGHYYTIDDIIVLNASQIELVCSQDVLATYKSAITGSSQYVLYANLSTYNKFIPDPRTVRHALKTKTVTSGPVTGLSTTGCFVINVVNDNPGTAGFTTSYIMSAAEIKRLAQYLLNDLSDASLQAVFDWVQKAFLNVYDSVIGCIWLPVDITTAQSLGTSEQVKIAKDNVTPGGTSFTAYKVTSALPLTIACSFASVPFDYNLDFRCASPYTQVQLYIPFYGVVDINPVDVYANSLGCNMYIDILTGDTTVKLTTGGKTLATINYCIAANCPIAQTQSASSGSFGSLLASAAGLGIAIGTGGAGAIAAGIGASVSAVNTAVDMSIGTASSKGSIQGRSMSSFNSFELIVSSIVTNDPYGAKDLIGVPVMQKMSLSSLSGYVQCANASVNLAGRTTDRDEVNAALDSGIYIE